MKKAGILIVTVALLAIFLRTFAMEPQPAQPQPPQPPVPLPQVTPPAQPKQELQIPKNIVKNSDFEIDADRDGIPDGWFRSEPLYWAGPAQDSAQWKELREQWGKKGAVPAVIPFRSPDILEGGTYEWESSGNKSGHSISIDETSDVKWGEWNTVVNGIKPNTEYVITGFRKQSEPLGRRPEQQPWLNIGIFGKMIPIKSAVDRDTWIPFAVQVNSGAFQGDVALGLIITPAPTKVWIDNLAIYEGTLADLTRFRLGGKAAVASIPFDKPAYASAEIEMPLFLDIAWSLQGAKEARSLDIIIDLPEGLDISGGDHAMGVKVSEPVAKGIVIEGKPYVRRTYTIITAAEKQEFDSAGNQPIRLWLKANAALLPGTILEARYFADWKSGSQPIQTLPVHIIKVEKVEQPKNLRFAIGGMSADLINSRAAKLVKDLPHLGINRIFADKALVPAVADLFDASGLKPVSMFRLGDNIPAEAQAKDAAGKVMSGVICPSYRAADAAKTLFASITEAAVNGTTNLYTDLLTAAQKPCFCERCVKTFEAYLKEVKPNLAFKAPADFTADPDNNKELAAAWNEFQMVKLADLYWTLRKQVDEARKAANPPAKNAVAPLRILAFVPPPTGDRAESRFDHNRISTAFDAVIIEPQPLAGDGSPAWTGDELTKLIKKLPVGSKAGVVVNAGTPQEPVLKYIDIRDRAIEAAVAGAETIVLQPLGSIDGMTLREFSQAIAILRPFEEILLQGDRVQTALSATDGVVAKCISQNSQLLLLLSERVPDTHMVADVKLAPDLVKFPSVLYDAQTQKVVGDVPAGTKDLKIQLTGQGRTHLYYIGPAERLPAKPEIK